MAAIAVGPRSGSIRRTPRRGRRCPAAVAERERPAAAVPAAARQADAAAAAAVRRIAASAGSAGSGRLRRGAAEDPPFSRSRTEGRTDRPTGREQGTDRARGSDRTGGATGPAATGRADRRGEHGERSAEQARYDGPAARPEEITGKELDHNIAQQLRGLPEKLAARVARHLVAAGLLIDDDPETAYQHTLAARARAARIAVVREACGEAAYAAGHYAEALAELRAAKRMNGVPGLPPGDGRLRTRPRPPRPRPGPGPQPRRRQPRPPT